MIGVNRKIMKWFGLYAVLIAAALFLNGCDTATGSDTKTQYYYYEFFTVSKSKFNSVPFPTTASFAAVKSYRDSLRKHYVEFLESKTDATRQDIYNFLTSKGFSPSEANTEISFVNSVGNDVAVFEYALDGNYYIIAYVEKI